MNTVVNTQSNQAPKTPVAYNQAPIKTFAPSNYIAPKACNHDGLDVLWEYRPEGREPGEVIEFVIADYLGCKPWKADVILDLAGNLTGGAEFVMKGPPEFLALNKLVKMPTVIRLQWPDYQAVSAPIEFWKEVLRLLPVGKRVMISCQGGHGRSGTALSALMIASGWYTASEAIEEVRYVHCKKAVEGAAQKNYLYKLANEELEDTSPSKQTSVKELLDTLESEDTTETFSTLNTYCVYCGRDFIEPAKSDICTICAEQKDVTGLDMPKLSSVAQSDLGDVADDEAGYDNWRTGLMYD